MLNWTPNFDAAADTVIDQITYFRLSRAPHHYPQQVELIWWSVLIELQGVSIDQFEASVQAFGQDLLIPAAYDAADRARVLPVQPVAIYARKPLIDHINRAVPPNAVASVWLGAITPSKFLDQGAVSEDFDDIVVDADTVVQAIVDDGIAIGHDLFRSGPDTSRIEYARIFDAEPSRASHASVGRALSKRDIDTYLRKCRFDGLLDEDLFYRLSGQSDMSQEVFSTVSLRTSHGTHVAALAAGEDMRGDRDPHKTKNAPRPIICAALPSRVVKDTTGVSMLPMLYLAFHILVKQARRFRTKQGALAPVVFNFSYGNNGGPHDGTGIFAEMFEHYFAEDAQRREAEPQKAWLVLPSGNANLAQLHAVDDSKADDKPVALDLTVLPDDRTPTHVQFWMPVSAADAQPDFATLRVCAPFGDSAGVIQTQPGQNAALLNSAGQAVAWLAYQYVGGTTQRGLVTLSINPTANLIATDDLAPAGCWTIEIKRNDAAPRGAVHVWVLRDDTLPGLQPGGRQAYFSNPDYQKYGQYGVPLDVDPSGSTCPVRRSGTISGFACGPSPVVVAAYTEKDALMSPYSAAGPLTPSPNAPHPRRDGPDVTARGDDSPVLRGVISAGSRSGSWVRMAGTSVAAPQIARLAAKQIRRGPADARDWATQAAEQFAFKLDGAPSAERAGAGGVRVPDQD